MALRSRNENIIATLPFSEVPVVKVSSLNKIVRKQTDYLQNMVPEGFENHREYTHSPTSPSILQYRYTLGLMTMKQVLCQYWSDVENT